MKRKQIEHPTSGETVKLPSLEQEEAPVSQDLVDRAKEILQQKQKRSVRVYVRRQACCSFYEEWWEVTGDTDLHDGQRVTDYDLYPLRHAGLAQKIPTPDEQ